MRTLIIGLDCFEPSLAFDRYADVMPTLNALREAGTWGPLRSTIPPITVPAWSCMTTGRDPGELGVYGFRNRKDHTYRGLSFALSTAIKAPRIWDLAGREDLRSIVVGVPQTYPPKRFYGELVASFLTPGPDSTFTHPPELKAELHAAAGEGGYMIDVADFRTDDKDRLLADIYEMTKRRFRVVRDFISRKEWDFFMMVEMGPDRLHHGFWRYCSPTHRLYEAGNPYESSIRDYYAHIDDELKQTLALVDDDVAVIVVSDHGARDMVGGLCINEWLIEQGWLTLKERPDTITKLTPDMIDWKNTKAWGEGGYYGRVFLNVEGREPLGQIPRDQYDAACVELTKMFEGITDPEGESIGTVAHRPRDVYKAVNNIAPDLMVFFGDLAWRSVGTVGQPSIHTRTNDTGPDDANHDWDGMFVLRDPGATPQGRVDDLSIYDVAPTVLDMLGVSPPDGLAGRILRNTATKG